MKIPINSIKVVIITRYNHVSVEPQNIVFLLVYKLKYKTHLIYCIDTCFKTYMYSSKTFIKNLGE